VPLIDEMINLTIQFYIKLGSTLLLSPSIAVLGNKRVYISIGYFDLSAVV